MQAEAISLVPPAAPTFEDCAVLELRDYTMQPGQRDVLIELFEREFIAGQEAAGMRVLGQFRDLDRPDHFVWLRGFQNMEARRRALEIFYSSALWLANRDAANATLVDSDHVNLLRPARGTWAFSTPLAPRPRRDADSTSRSRFDQDPTPHPQRDQAATHPTSVFVATVCVLPAPPGEPFKRGFEREALPLLRDCAAMPCAVLETEPASNTYPRLPVRSEWVFAWLARFAHRDAAERALEQLAASPRWNKTVLPRLGAAPLRVMRLQPAVRSWLR